MISNLLMSGSVSSDRTICRGRRTPSIRYFISDFARTLLPITNLFDLYDYIIINAQRSSPWCLHIEFDPDLALRPVCLAKRFYFFASILIIELKFIGIEINIKNFLVEFNEVDEFGIGSHFYCFFPVLTSYVGQHGELDLLPIVVLCHTIYNTTHPYNI